MRYETRPLVLSPELTNPVKPPLFQSDTDLVEYALQLLGDIEQMNHDRVTVRESIKVHNEGAAKGTPRG